MKAVKTVVITEDIEEVKITSTFAIWPDGTYTLHRAYYNDEACEAHTTENRSYASYEEWAKAIEEEAWGTTLFIPAAK